MAALLYIEIMSIKSILVKTSLHSSNVTYQGHRAEQVCCVDLLPVGEISICDGCHGAENAMVDDKSVETPKCFDGQLCDFRGRLGAKC